MRFSCLGLAGTSGETFPLNSAVAAALSLGALYESGLIVPRNYQEAYFWYSVLNDQLGEPIVGETVKEKLSPAERASVQRRVAEWKAQSERRAAITHAQQGQYSPPSNYQPPSQNNAPTNGVQFIKKFDTNTGIVGMSYMVETGSQQLYWYPKRMKEFHSQEQIDFFLPQERVPYAVFGTPRTNTYKKVEGTTNCSTAVFESLFKLVGGRFSPLNYVLIGGSINGVPVTDARFNSFGIRSVRWRQHCSRNPGHVSCLRKFAE